jgi:beta-fructofuranosidase
MRISSRIDRAINFLPKGRNRMRYMLRKGAIVWDPWLLKDGEFYRLFFLANPKVLKPNVFGTWWSESSIYGAISTNLKNWKILSPVLVPEPNNDWESQRLFAGSTYKEEGIYYLFYTASGTKDFYDESLGLATSIDGINWSRCLNYQLFSNLIDRDRWYGKYECDFGDGKMVQHRHWRDPYILRDHKTGKYYMFICAASQQIEHSLYRGCVGLAVADNISGPYKLLPPACKPIVEGTSVSESAFIEMERPQVIYKNGKYHLFFSCWKHRINPKWLKQIDSNRITNSSLYWYVADEITGPYLPNSNQPIVLGSDTTEMYGVNFFPAPNTIGGEFIACGWFYWSFTLGVSPSFRVIWTDESIEISRNRISLSTITDYIKFQGAM